jgi:sec-independent protein translocase protein TatA
MSFGPTELLIVLAIVLLLFGSTKLPQLARSLGQASKEFKDGQSGSPGTDAPSR